MVATITAFGALFAATFIFLTGNGLLNTLLSARLAVEGYSTATTGMILTCYFTGLLIGSFTCQRIIQRVGHIRAFATFAATTTAAALLYGLHVAPWFWATLRLANGITTFGLFMVIESWLNECTAPGQRGRVFAIYMTLTYLGIGIGQQLLNIGGIGGPDLFIITGVIFALCLVPVSATEGVHPLLPETKPFRFTAIFRNSPLGMLGCMAAGLSNSAFYAMMPVVCTRIGMDVHHLAWTMSATVFAGLGAQWLVGRLSDRFDRTVVLFVIVAAIALLCAVIFVSTPASFAGLALPMALFGALCFAVYPLSVARAHDIFGGRDAVAVSAALLFAYSIGASVSPALASLTMTLTGSPYGLFVFWLLVNGALAATTLYLRKREKIVIVPVADQVNFVPMKETSPVAITLDPRGDGGQV